MIQQSPLSSRSIGRLLQRAAIGIGGILPRGVSRLPYVVALEAVRKAFSFALGPDAEIWPRNSFLTSAFVPGKSDLDLTIVFKNKPSRSELVTTRRVLHTARGFFPLLGESNVYLLEDLSLVAVCMNAFELARDPQLRARVQATAKQAEGSRGDASIFLLRALESDLENLSTSPAQRKPKWEAHFKTVVAHCGQAPELRWDETPEPELLERLIEALAAFVAVEDPGKASRIQAVIREYLAAARSGALLGTLQTGPLHFALFPHRFCFMTDIPVFESKLEQAMARGQVSWEIAGLLGQYLLADNPRQLLAHIENLSRVASVLPDADNLKIGLGRIASRLQVAAS